MSYQARELIYMLEEIIEKEEELNAGSRAWSEEDSDPCEMAACDPSDQFLLGEEIEELWKEFKQKVNGVDRG